MCTTRARASSASAYDECRLQQQAREIGIRRIRRRKTLDRRWASTSNAATYFPRVNASDAVQSLRPTAKIRSLSAHSKSVCLHRDSHSDGRLCHDDCEKTLIPKQLLGALSGLLYRMSRAPAAHLRARLTWKGEPRFFFKLLYPVVFYNDTQTLEAKFQGATKWHN